MPRYLHDHEETEGDELGRLREEQADAAQAAGMYNPEKELAEERARARAYLERLAKFNEEEN